MCNLHFRKKINSELIRNDKYLKKTFKLISFYFRKGNFFLSFTPNFAVSAFIDFICNRLNLSIKKLTSAILFCCQKISFYMFLIVTDKMAGMCIA